MLYKSNYLYRLWLSFLAAFLMNYSALAFAQQRSEIDVTVTEGVAEVSVPESYVAPDRRVIERNIPAVTRQVTHRVVKTPQSLDTINGIKGKIDFSRNLFEEYHCKECVDGSCEAELARFKVCQLSVQIIESEIENITSTSNYRISALNYENMIFHNHARQTKIIFFISNFILMAGFIAALVELWNAQKLRIKASKIRNNMDNTDVVVSPSDIDVTLGFDRLALKSSINGVALFVITIFFYFMYIKFVYSVV